MPHTDPDKVRFLHGPYRTPKLRRGDRAQCHYRDKDVIVTGISSARIPWPLCKPVGRGLPGLLVEEELARAIRCESSLALQHWWGASPRVVWCWRKALGVGRFTEGSLRLMRLVGQAGADALRGQPLPPVGGQARPQGERLAEAGRVRPDEDIVAFNTGAAQMYPEAVPLDLPRLDKDRPVDYAALPRV
jgi:hypothetical protein